MARDRETRWMEKRFPKALRRGDKVALVSPASPLGKRREDLDRGLARLEGWGFVPELMPNALRALDWPEGGELAGTDAQRASDLNAAIRGREYRAIVCIRGGYGTTRLLGRLDFAALARDPKPILGYSDITALLAAAWREAGLVGLHGPMVATSAADATGKENLELQCRLLTETARPAVLPAAGAPAHVLVEGQAEGNLVGGNLSLVAALIGTPWELDTRGAILFLEDIHEAPYRIDRMLTQLMQAGLLGRAAGICLGDFHLDGTPPASESPDVLRVLQDRLQALGVPVAHGFPFGHRPRSWTLPFGVRARFEATDAAAPATLTLLEPAVR